MGGAGVACKFLGILFILSLPIQGICAAQTNNVTSTVLNNSINSTINGTIIGNFNGTLNSTTNETFNGTIVGTINGTLNGTISNTEVFPSILLLPLFLGALLFLFWLCRFFDRMNFCFVSFLLIALLVGLLWHFRLPLMDMILEYILYFLILILVTLSSVIVYETYKQMNNEKNEGNKKEGSNEKDESTERVKNNLIMWLHDIARNFIIIFVVLA